MDDHRLSSLLEAVRRGDVSIDQAIAQLRPGDGQELGFANLDHNRGLRTGVPEVVFCQGKTTDQVIQIVGQILQHEGRVLATRASPDLAAAVCTAFPAAHYHDLARIISLGNDHTPVAEPGAPYTVVATGGTSDMPVAEEAALTLEFLGDPVRRVYDVGVAGIHRLLGKRDVFSGASVIVVVAGMEGALASVVGGLVDCPVVAVPTSVGYGASFGGLAALLAMLNSCAPGVAVVNIDNGFGAAVHAHKMMQKVLR
jgi:pyridinium-3,5-biscarboxylic acid mononucleotide synthase